MRAAIFLNGTNPPLKLIRGSLRRCSLIIGADGGANLLYRKNIKPDIIIGDMDSISSEAVDFFTAQRVKLLRIREQETTDFEKCLNFCVKNKIPAADVFGSLSMRPDHMLNNFSVMKRYSRKMQISLVSDEFEVFFAPKHLKFSYRIHETVSLLGMPVAKCVTTSGLRYKLNCEDLEFGKREGSLNEAVSDSVEISHSGGHLLLFRKHFNN